MNTMEVENILFVVERIGVPILQNCPKSKRKDIIPQEKSVKLLILYLSLGVCQILIVKYGDGNPQGFPFFNDVIPSIHRLGALEKDVMSSEE